MKSLFHDVVPYDVAIVIPRHEQYLEIRIDPTQVVDQHRAAHAGHDNISKEKIRPASESFKSLDRGIGTLRCDDLVALFGQDRLEEANHIRFVVHNQHGPARRVRNGSGGQRIKSSLVDARRQGANVMDFTMVDVSVRCSVSV
jgi:hypothetical protein